MDRHDESVLCSHCGGKNVSRYSYGLHRPLNDDEKENVKNDESNKKSMPTILGGCVVSKESPAYRCGDCGKDFGKFEWKK